MKIGYYPTKNKYNKKFPMAEFYVIHKTVGGYEGAKSWLAGENGNNASSAHYLIPRSPYRIEIRNGKEVRIDQPTIQFADLDERTWHAGFKHEVSDRGQKLLGYDLKKNPNHFSISVEFEALKEGETIQVLTDYQIEEFLRIVDKNHKNGHTVGLFNLKDHLGTHKDFTSYKPNFDASWGRILNKAERLHTNTDEYREEQIRELESQIKVLLMKVIEMLRARLA